MEQVIENNKLIAEFMGIPKCDRCDDCDSYKYGSGIYFSPLSMSYHTSWDWLMPVVEKISKIKFEDEDTAFPRTFGAPYENSQGITEYMVRFNRHALFSNEAFITAAYDAVVDFIETYNSQAYPNGTR